MEGFTIVAKVCSYNFLILINIKARNLPSDMHMYIIRTIQSVRKKDDCFFSYKRSNYYLSFHLTNKIVCTCIMLVSVNSNRNQFLSQEFVEFKCDVNNGRTQVYINIYPIYIFLYCKQVFCVYMSTYPFKIQYNWDSYLKENISHLHCYLYNYFSPHKEIIQRVYFLKNTSRYIGISKVR